MELLSVIEIQRLEIKELKAQVQRQIEAIKRLGELAQDASANFDKLVALYNEKEGL